MPRSIKDETVYSGKHFGYGEHSYFGYGTVTMEINIVVSQKTYLSYLKIPLNQSVGYTHRTLYPSREILFIHVQ